MSWGFLHSWSGVYMGPGLQRPARCGTEGASHQSAPTSSISLADPTGPDCCRGGTELCPLCVWGRVRLGQKWLRTARIGKQDRYKNNKKQQKKIKKELNFFAICTFFFQHKNLTYNILSADQDTPTPVDCLIMKRTVHISCGKDHTVILTKVRHGILVTALAPSVTS